MITFESSPIVDLVTEALRHQALDEFAAAVVSAVAASPDFSTEQSLAVNVVTDRLVRLGGAVQALLEYVMNGDWSTAVSVPALSSEQREAILGYIIDQAKSVLAAKAAELTALAAASYAIPQEEPE